MRVALLGATGVIGSAVANALRRVDAHICPVPAPRIICRDEMMQAVHIPATLVRTYEAQIAQLTTSLRSCQVVVLAAGLAAPAAQASPALFGANGVLPAVTHAAALRAGVDRMVHISSAVVQGNRPTLDETPSLSPLSPYAASKALGEKALFALTRRDPTVEVVIYRPTSVLAPSRQVSLQLLRMLSGPVVPVPGTGESRQPLALVENVAAAVVTLILAPTVATINLHPWEGMSIARLLTLSDRHVVRIPVPVAAIDAMVAIARRSGSVRLSSAARRMELYTHGQNIKATALVEAGFEPVVGEERYRELLQYARQT